MISNQRDHGSLNSEVPSIRSLVRLTVNLSLYKLSASSLHIHYVPNIQQYGATTIAPTFLDRVQSLSDTWIGTLCQFCLPQTIAFEVLNILQQADCAYLFFHGADTPESLTLLHVFLKSAGFEAPHVKGRTLCKVFFVAVMKGIKAGKVFQQKWNVYVPVSARDERK